MSAGRGLSMAVCWYHSDLSCVQAEDLLVRAGRDGSFLVRDSESVPGAYALCLLFQRHVHTYRIVPNEEGLLAVQTIPGLPVKCFRTLADLITTYQQPNKGLVTALLYPVTRDKEAENDCGGEVSSPQQRTGPDCGTLQGPVPPLKNQTTWQLQRQMQESINSPVPEFMALLTEYGREQLQLDLDENQRSQQLSRRLVTVCRGLHSEIDITLSSLETLIKVFDQSSSAVSVKRKQTSSLPPSLQTDGESSPRSDQDLELLFHKIFTLTSLLSSLEEKAVTLLQESFPKSEVAPSSSPQPPPTFQKREDFCHLLQLMKIKHTNLDEPNLISVYIGTWNMSSSPPPPPHSMSSWLTARGLGYSRDESVACIPHDVYVIGTQENSMGDREWLEFLQDSLKSLMAIDFKVVALQTHWSIKLAVLVKPEHECRISHVSTSTVKTGLAHALGTKGAVGISFLFNGTSFAFVNCHLASGREKTARRNQSYKDILRSLTLGDKTLSDFDISLRFNHLFWFGNLNYCLEMDVQEILSHVSRKEFETLRAVDQLNQERERNKAFLKFNEEKVTFPPTYRYERGSRDSYSWQKLKTTGVRISAPSWCDRILWRSHPETYLLCTSYGCSDDITSSDHSPVFATFKGGITPLLVSKKDPSTSLDPARIEFESIEVIIKTRSRSKCFIEFHSTCLPEFRRSGDNSSESSEVAGFLKLLWSGEQLPELCPILADLDYLVGQHLLLTVRSLDSCESYGECCIALGLAFGSAYQHFETFLSHNGEETGSIRGWMRAQVPSEQHGRRERLFEWIKDESVIDAPKAGLTVSRASQCDGTPPPQGRSGPHTQRLEKSRSQSFSVLSSSSSFTNPAYFIFEGVPISQTPSPNFTEPPNSPSICRNEKENPTDNSRCHGQYGGSFHLVPEVPQWLRENIEVHQRPNYCVPKMSHAPHKPSSHRRPKSTIIMKDPVCVRSSGEASFPSSTRRTADAKAQSREGQGPMVDCFLAVVDRAECLSEVKGSPIQGALALSGDPTRAGKKPLCQTQSALGTMHGFKEEPKSQCRDRQAPSNPVEIESSSTGQWLSTFGLQQYEEGFVQNGWTTLKDFRDISNENLREAGVLSPIHRRLILAKLQERRD